MKTLIMCSGNETEVLEGGIRETNKKVYTEN